MDRRAFLGTTASTLLLPGCATLAGRTGLSGRTGCLPKVDVSPERVIRTVAGLRPYRSSGFVVRADMLGDKKLVHNYGHGGAGITLSWGTSKLAANLGLPGHKGPVAVLGSGVVGLSTARLAQEAGFPVTIYAKALPPDTTSNVAGGQFHPFGLYRKDMVTPEWRDQFRAALDYSWRRFQIHVGDDYGVRWLTTYSEGEPETREVPTFPPAMRALGRAEHPFPIEQVYRFDTLYVETGRYLRQLMRDFLGAGGRFEIRSFASPAQVAGLPERVVFNCTGLGARDLFGDTELRPIRGQLAILLPQPEVRYAFTFETGYMFPRADGIVVGGTFERDKWEAVTEPARIADILERHRKLFADFRCRA